MESALAAAKSGFRVFPCAPNGKKPLLEESWKEIATRDEQTLRDWWSQFPDANPAIALDANHVVVDVDAGGHDAFDYVGMCGLPDTLIVDTPSGGKHVYLTTDKPYGNRAKTIPDLPGCDLRGANGYVLAPGSSIDGKPYAVTSPALPAPCPDWLHEILRKQPREVPKSDAPLIELDRPESLERAKSWLETGAPDAIEGAGGDQATYSVAARLRDFGLSQHKALDFMLEHWNERQSPPWQPDDLAVKVDNAFRYASGAWGGQSAAAEFDAIDIDVGEPPAVSEKAIQTSDSKRPLVASPVNLDDLRRVPPRRWLYGTKLQRKYTGFLAAPGGAGKTAWVIAATLAMASGEKLLSDQPHGKLRVWVYNLEDDIDEMRRRLAGAIDHYGLDQSVLDNVRLNSGRDRPFRIMGLQNDNHVVLPDAKALVAAMKAEAVDVLIVDPFLRSHGVPENDNAAQDAVMGLYAQIADAADAAVLLVHHVKKGAVAGEMDSMRGASTQGGGARSVYTMSAMTAEEAEKLGVAEAERRLHVRLDDAKNNMAPPGERAEWIRLQSVDLGNGDEDYPGGDAVQVAVRWSPPEALEGLEPDAVDRMLDAVLAGREDGERWSVRKQDGDRWVGVMLEQQFGRSMQQAKALVDLWTRQRRIIVGEYRSPTQRKTRQGILRPANEMQEVKL